MTDFVATAVLIVCIFAIGIIFGAILTLFLGGYTKRQYPKHMYREISAEVEGDE